MSDALAYCRSGYHASATKAEESRLADKRKAAGDPKSKEFDLGALVAQRPPKCRPLFTEPAEHEDDYPVEESEEVVAKPSATNMAEEGRHHQQQVY